MLVMLVAVATCLHTAPSAPLATSNDWPGPGIVDPDTLRLPGSYWLDHIDIHHLQDENDRRTRFYTQATIVDKDGGEHGAFVTVKSNASRLTLKYTVRTADRNITVNFTTQGNGQDVTKCRYRVKAPRDKGADDGAFLDGGLVGGGGGGGGAKSAELTTMDDTFIMAVDPNESYWDGAPSCPNCAIALKLTTSGDYQGEARTLLKYWVYDLPNSAEITSASLLFRDLSGSTNNGPDSVSFSVYRITSVWFQSTATWNNAPSYDPTPVAQGTISGSSFSVLVPIPTSLVQGWVDGTIANNGLLIRTNSSGTSTSHKTFPSYNWDGIGVPLEVEYK